MERCHIIFIEVLMHFCLNENQIKIKNAVKILKWSLFFCAPCISENQLLDQLFHLTYVSWNCRDRSFKITAQVLSASIRIPPRPPVSKYCLLFQMHIFLPHCLFSSKTKFSNETDLYENVWINAWKCNSWIICMCKER